MPELFGCLLAVEQYKREGLLLQRGDMDNMHGVLPTGKTHLNLGVENFIGAKSLDTVISHMADLSLQLLQGLNLHQANWSLILDHIVFKHQVTDVTGKQAFLNQAELIPRKAKGKGWLFGLIKSFLDIYPDTIK